MANGDVSAPGARRNTVRQGTVDPFKKDAADLASERAKGESKREAAAPPGGRRIPAGIGGDIKAKKYKDLKTIEDMS